MIYGSLRKPTLDRFFLVIHLSVGAAVILSIVISVVGYLTFGSATKGKGYDFRLTVNLIEKHRQHTD